MFLQEEGVMLVPHPPYSPDLAPSDFWLFGYLKQQLGSYPNSKSLQLAVTRELRAIPQGEFRKAFQSWVNRMKLCIDNKGDYFEHLMK